MCCQMGWIGCAILQVTQKAIVRIQFLSYFWDFSIKYWREKRCQILRTLFWVLQYSQCLNLEICRSEILVDISKKCTSYKIRTKMWLSKVQSVKRFLSREFIKYSNKLFRPSNQDVTYILIEINKPEIVADTAIFVKSSYCVS